MRKTALIALGLLWLLPALADEGMWTFDNVPRERVRSQYGVAIDRAGEVDLVLLDIAMPRMDGFGVLEEMKSDPALRDIPVIMISAVDDHESVIRCIEAGAEDHLPKPFDPVLLRARINAGLARKRLHVLERDRLRDVFTRFLPESVVEEVLLQGGGDPRLGGLRVDATVMFCDLRGFTSFAERTPPDRVIEVLNHYLGEMTDAVLDARWDVGRVPR